MMGSILNIGSDYETARLEVYVAMVFPRDEQLRTAYKLRHAWIRRIKSDASVTATAGEIQAMLDLPSWREMRHKAKKGTRTGTVAGDLLALIYQQSRIGASEPSMRDALKRYKRWSLGKTYGDGERLKYSVAQLRKYFEVSIPSAHLWAAIRLLTAEHGAVNIRTAFEPQCLPRLLGVARSIQDFAETFVPKRTKPAKPIVNGADLHRVPDRINAIELDLRPL